MPRYSTALSREMSSIRTSFRRLARSFGRIAPLLTAATAATSQMEADDSGPSRRRPRLSMAQRRALKLQGKYMGTMRGLKPSQRTEIKKLRASKGIEAAIKLAQKLAK
ncbi:MAG TPA: hypothetical protein VFG76_04725 [Candidatus Polarisedimenticolia bacterium]|nr:hypothetical protein [Candidatus Polarisedimenticolia bacterium]